MSELAPTAISRPRPSDLIPGYRLLELVGKGGMGEVHRATQLSLDRRVAVKLLAQNLAGDPGFVARFEKEAAALAQLSHPNIVSIVDKGRAAETYYLVMEFVEGPSLRELLRSGITALAALRAIHEVARAIDYAHGRGIVHRDLKPENILIDQQAGNICKVSDFGLAGFLDDGAGRFNVTATHVAMGTLAYMAPEQRVDAKNADHRADIYSLGVMLYELLTGEAPMGSFAPPSQRKGGVDPRLDAIVERCLKPDPKDRYARVAELLADLEPMVPSLSTPLPRPLTPWERAGVRARRVGTLVGRTAAGLLVVTAGLTLAIAVARNRQPRPVPELPGAAFSRELPQLSQTKIAARVEDKGLTRRATFGAGPDEASLLPFGRPAQAASDGTVRFDSLDPAAPVGRATLDLSGAPGDGVTLTAEVVAQPAKPTFRSTWRRLVLGEQPVPRAALTLRGIPGRSAMVVLGAPGEPVALEWVFGERRGAMLGPPTPEGPTTVTIEVDAEGSLRARVGSNDELRQVGEPVAFGKGWRSELFGITPVPELGCANGACTFRELTFSVSRQPEPPPVIATVTAPTSMAEPPPAPPSHGSTRPPARKKEPARAEREERHDALKHVEKTVKSLIPPPAKKTSAPHKGREGK